MLEMIRGQVARGLRKLLPRWAQRFAGHQDGSAAVEFGFVALPFLALTFAIIETALVFFAGQTLEAAVADSARLIMTGQAQTSNYTQASFKTAVCSKIAGLFDCAGGVYVDVKKYSSFSSVSTASPVTNGQFDPTKMTYQPGDPGDIVVVSLYYEWPIYVSLLSNNLSNLSGKKRLLVATAAFRNEPFK